MLSWMVSLTPSTPSCSNGRANRAPRRFPAATRLALARTLHPPTRTVDADNFRPWFHSPLAAFTAPTPGGAGPAAPPGSFLQGDRKREPVPQFPPHAETRLRRHSLNGSIRLVVRV